ncbi:F-actin-uncapping protein LRRC16A isoform X2 [Electrophorus electricus]|uniref:F-actin-uncapping protein LRRC16A isoform X2 n=1 Tax=Electrophorus electricus TaxID=8005 RepID=UPI0015D0A8CA|nr:F-actin-uncapping protein LRRC16A isoform X2 [Electrophorus electricus]
MSEETSNVPKELLESVRDAVGRKTKLVVKKRVKLEIKGDKVENRVLALAAYRGYLLTARIPAKVEQTFSYLEIHGITCNKPTQLMVEHEKGQIPLRLLSTEEVNEVVSHIGSSLQRICPGLSPVRVMKKLSMEPPERITVLQTVWESQSSAEPGPCGGFSQQYRCVCDWLGLPYREEVQWDVDTIYLTQDTRELNLQDFSHLENRDLVAIIAVLEFNQWFTKLSTKDYKLSADVCDQILRVVARSSRLEELVLDNAGLKTDFAQKLASALAHNPNSGLHTLNLANNPLEDRGITSLGAQFAKLRKGLKHLNFSRTSLSPKGVNSLAQSLSASQSIPSTLCHLDLSGNLLRGDDLSSFYSFLGQPNSLSTLDLSNADCLLELLCSALLRGCLQHLVVLNVSKSVFAHRKGKEIPPSFKHFFSSSLALNTLNVSGTKLPPEALKSLLLGLASNPNLKEVTLDLSCCELRSGGSQILEGCIAEIPNISSLDISDNGLDSDMSTLLVWLAKNRSIRHLSLGKNFNNIKSKNLAPVLDNLVHMIQEEESPLMSLSLADSKLKGDLTIVLNALGSNSSLTRVDVSGNSMGDMGAKMLAKALQINSKLRTVIWDRNNVSPQGLQDVAAALEKNFTIRFMPLPIIDASQALKTNPEKTEDALLRMENYLYRNHETRKYVQEQAYRLQQGIVTTTTQQMIDRICVKVQDHLNSLKNSEKDGILEDVKVAENLIKDARNSKTLLPCLYHLGVVSREEPRDSSMGPIQEKLDSMAGEMAQVMDEQLKGLLESMVGAAESLCPHVMRKANLRQDLIKASMDKLVIPRTFVKNVLLEQAGVDIINKISEVKLSLASFLSDRIVDEILEALSNSQNTLGEHLLRKGRPLVLQESLDLDVLEVKISKRGATEPLEAERLDDLETCMMTPKSKRKSIHSRMLRPVSRAFEMEFDLDKALENVPIHVEDLAPLPRLEKKLSAGVVELPSEEAKKLHHYTKLRPKRNKKTQSSRVPISSVPSQDGEQNGLMGRVDEGVDEFFSKRVTRIDKRPSLKSSDSQDSERKRESRKGGFLNLIKSRSGKSDKDKDKEKSQPPASAAGSTQATPVAQEEPLSPRPSSRSPAPEVKAKSQCFPPERSSSSDRSEELKTPDSADSELSEGSPQGGRRYGVQVMGCGLLAEMKAKQEKRATFSSHKVSDSSSCSDKTEAPLSGVSKAEGGCGVCSPEKVARGGADGKPETAPRSRGAGPTSTCPKPPPQVSKPALAARPAIPQKPRSSSCRSIEEGSESPAGGPKSPALTSTLRKSPLDRDGNSGSPQGSSGPKSAQEVTAAADASVFKHEPEGSLPNPEEESEQAHKTSLSRPARALPTSDGLRTPAAGQPSSEDNGSKFKERSDSGAKEKEKDSSHACRSADSGEDGDKDFIFI